MADSDKKESKVSKEKKEDKGQSAAEIQKSARVAYANAQKEKAKEAAK